MKYINESKSCGVLKKMDVHPVLANALQRALRAEFGHQAATSMKQNVACVRYLVVCLQALNIHHTVPLPATVMWDINKWMQGSGFKNSTNQSRQNVILILLRWCHRNLPSVIDRRATFDVPSFLREKRLPSKALAEDTIKKILAACYSEIEEIENRLLRSKKLLLEDANSVDKEFKRLVEDLLIVGDGRIPSQQGLRGYGLGLYRRVEKYGGLREIRSRLYLLHEDVLPFYLAIVVQTAGNPIAIMEAEMNCIEPHPLRTDLEFLNWNKRRSRAEQRVDFPVDKKWSAPNLVRRLLVLNSPLREFASSKDLGRLFLAHGANAQAPNVPSVQTLHNSLAKFSRKYAIDNFDFRDFRRSSAKAHRVAGGTVEVARHRLNHRNASTTSKYYSGPEDVSQFNDEAIVRYQGMLITLSSQSNDFGKTNPELVAADLDISRPAETVFGFQCADPFAGIEGRSPKGTQCMHFSQCSTCRGAIIPVDDPFVIAKVLSSQIALKQAKLRAERSGWDLRFKKLYAPTLDVIEKEILPFVHADVLRIARDHINESLIPVLE